jgi:hypothetical protein
MVAGSSLLVPVESRLLSHRHQGVHKCIAQRFTVALPLGFGTQQRHVSYMNGLLPTISREPHPSNGKGHDMLDTWSEDKCWS